MLDNQHWNKGKRQINSLAQNYSPCSIKSAYKATFCHSPPSPDNTIHLDLYRQQSTPLNTLDLLKNGTIYSSRTTTKTMHTNIPLMIYFFIECDQHYVAFQLS